jgi:hypothetical protein
MDRRAEQPDGFAAIGRIGDRYQQHRGLVRDIDNEAAERCEQDDSDWNYRKIPNPTSRIRRARLG